MLTNQKQALVFLAVTVFPSLIISLPCSLRGLTFSIHSQFRSRMFFKHSSAHCPHSLPLPQSGPFFSSSFLLFFSLICGPPSLIRVTFMIMGGFYLFKQGQLIKGYPPEEHDSPAATGHSTQREAVIPRSLPSRDRMSRCPQLLCELTSDSHVTSDSAS